MSRRWPQPVLTALVCALALAACAGNQRHVPNGRTLPLVPRIHEVSRLVQCDRGSDPYCQLSLIEAAPTYRTSHGLVMAEQRLLRRRGWTSVNAPLGSELAAMAPGDRLRVQFGAAAGQLEAIELGWIKYPRRIAVTLAHLDFSHTSAMAIVLQIGGGAT